MADIDLKEIANNKKVKRIPNIKGISEPKAVERQYIKMLNQLAFELKKEVRENILPLLKTTSLDGKIATDGISEILQALNTLTNKFSNVESFAMGTSNTIIEKINELNKGKFYRNVNSSIGVNLEDIINEQGLNDIVQLQKSKNVSLIKSIPQEFIKDIEVIVQNGISEGLSTRAIENGIKDINSVFGKLSNRIKLISKNEVSSINSSLAKARATSVGVRKGIWRNARDSRVRGNPSGKYANANQDHWSIEGEIFDLDKGVKDPRSGDMIFPGSKINCRCITEFIID